MRLPTILRVAAVSLALTACGGDDAPEVDGATGLVPLDAGVDAMPDGMMPVTLHFRAKIGREELVCGQRYEGLGSSKIAGEPQDFRVFVHNLRLIDASGAKVPVQLDDRPPFQSAELALLDFTDGRGSCTTGAPESNTAIYGRVPAGTYTGIAFTTGVPEALNHADPERAPAPLKAPGMHWTWRQGYRFVMAELDVDEGLAELPDAGAASTSGASGASGGSGHDRSGRPSLAFAHLGSLNCLGGVGTFRCERPNRSEIELGGFDPAKNGVVADLAAVFEGYDLRGVVACHGDAACAQAFTAFGVDPASGAPAPSQRVFRVD